MATQARRWMTGFGTALLAAGCGGSSTFVEVDSGDVDAANEDIGETADALTGSFAVGTEFLTTTGLNLRSGAGTNYRVLRVMPGGSRVSLVAANPSAGWYNINHQGQKGWAHGGYLRLAPSPSQAPANDTARGAAIARARAAVGFSYWWGHGRWDPSGPSSSTAGACTGSCPNCTHSGRYGADCSGYVGKVWQVGPNNTDPTVDAHPYSTWNFDNERHGWTAIGRDSMQKADALVYNANGAGHMLLFESGDPWGSVWSYEARGCSYGIVHNLRSVGSAYKGIARDGY